MQSSDSAYKLTCGCKSWYDGAILTLDQENDWGMRHEFTTINVKILMYNAIIYLVRVGESQDTHSATQTAIVHISSLLPLVDALVEPFHTL